MKMTNAAAKLEREGFKVTYSDLRSWTDYEGNLITETQPGRLFARRPGSRQVVEIIRNGHADSVATIRVRTDNDHDDMQSDYHAGSFYPTLAQAIARVSRWDVEEIEHPNRFAASYFAGRN